MCAVPSWYSRKTKPNYTDRYFLTARKKEMTANVEIVLPSGKFARIRPILTIDFLMATKAEHMMAALVALTTLIDDEYLTYGELMQMPIEDSAPLMSIVSAKLESAHKTIKGVI